MHAADQEVVVQRVDHTDELALPDRAAAILVLVFGHQLEDVVGLTWDDVKVAEDPVLQKERFRDVTSAPFRPGRGDRRSPAQCLSAASVL